MAGRWLAVLCAALALTACSEPVDALFSPSTSVATGAPAAGASSLGGAASRDPRANAGGAPSDGGALGDASVAVPSLTPDAGFCTGQAVTMAELASGSVRSGATVLLPKLVASSQKFLLSASKTSGKCLWGAFAAELGKSGENSGVLLLSSVDGVDAAEVGSSARCPGGTDSIPDDLAPGDLLSGFGDFEDYAPSACQGSAPMRELLVKAGCALTRMGHTEPPSATLLAPDLADRLAQGKDEALLRAWSGARVELDDVDALAAPGSTGAVGAYGVIRLQQTKLELHSKVPYADLSSGGPNQPGKSLDFDFPQHFTRALGVLFLDYCTWSLEVCDRCTDLTPQSRGCPPSGG